MALRLNAKPILNFALLPVERRQLCRQRRKRRLGGQDGRLDNHPGGRTGRIENVIDVKEAFSLEPILGENCDQARSLIVEKILRERSDIRAVQHNDGLVVDRFIDGNDLPGKKRPEALRERS